MPWLSGWRSQLYGVRSGSHKSSDQSNVNVQATIVSKKLLNQHEQT